MACGSAPPPAAGVGTEPTRGGEIQAAAAPSTRPVAAALAQATATESGDFSHTRAQLAEVLSWANGAPLDEATYRTRFTQEFVTAFPYARFAGVLSSLRGEPWQSSAVDVSVKLVGHWKRGEQSLRVSLAPSSADPSRIEHLLFTPDKEAASAGAATSASDAIERLQALGTLALLTAATTKGTCEPLTRVDAERSQPVGSTFKLWVLAAVLKKVRAGELKWTDPITIQDKLDSLPSGITQRDPDGSTRSLRELAERMIAISDNTATDHLIAKVGRTAVEKAVADIGHAHPELVRPFLTTRELSILKFGPDETLRNDYVAANEAGRRTLLATRVATAPLPDLKEVERQIAKGPRLIREIEWLGSPLDLCRVLVALEKDEAASKILAINPGIPDSAHRWSYVGYKGGSEPGVLTMAWEHEAANGEHYVTAASLSNGDAALPEDSAAKLMAAVRDAVR
jgi:beta-lactamase class A